MADETVEHGRRLVKGVKDASSMISHTGDQLVVKNAEMANLINSKFSELSKAKGPHKEMLDVDVSIRW